MFKLQHLHRTATPHVRRLSQRTAKLLAGLQSRDRAALARSITLVESTRASDLADSRELLSACVKHSGAGPRRALRIGLTGTPGVGKSTFIEALGMHAIKAGHRLAVLAVDPSSSRSGGSILGDKTRMQELSVSPEAFVRPSPSRGTLGGVARNTLASILLCETAGFDVCFVETVGVGQSETVVADMVDMFVLLMQPGSGDELQGVKRGIMEVADLVVVNKADGHLELPAKTTRSDIASALRLLAPARACGWHPKVVRASARTGFNIDRVWEAVLRYFGEIEGAGEWALIRERQREMWMWREVRSLLVERITRDPSVKETAEALRKEVARGVQSPSVAAEMIVEKFVAGGCSSP